MIWVAYLLRVCCSSFTSMGLMDMHKCGNLCVGLSPRILKGVLLSPSCRAGCQIAGNMCNIDSFIPANRRNP